ADMRRKTGKPIKSLKRASIILKRFEDAEHLEFALETCVANDYQGLKPEYKPEKTIEKKRALALKALELPIEDGS
ncbi:hypothetical protein, partial [Legionella anisa]|uniref:hypothetical protein n=1 Tax=Legionella anisa TaxID=28082 RepID=UPI00399C956C